MRCSEFRTPAQLRSHPRRVDEKRTRLRNGASVPIDVSVGSPEPQVGQARAMDGANAATQRRPVRSVGRSTFTPLRLARAAVRGTAAKCRSLSARDKGRKALDESFTPRGQSGTQEGVFILLSKTLDVLLSPLGWVFVLGASAALLGRRWPRSRPWLFGTAFVVLYLASAPFVAGPLMRAVESSAVTTDAPGSHYDAVIVLGGLLDSELSAGSGQREFTHAVERLIQAHAVFREGRAERILLSGGNTFPKEGVPPESTFLASQLEAWGVPAEAIVIEDRSRNTRENATESRDLIDKHGWKHLLLITSAAHLPRAEACFRAVGLNVSTLAVDRRAASRTDWSLLPRASSLLMTSDAVREVAGRWIYRVRGYADFR